MSDSGKAVFLSYASQDADAARRICEALRAAGVEVWFDQSELVGGDAWDQKIRKQIRDCALLIPVISKNTQARAEGYFRLEWRLADQRTHLMGKSKAFLLPLTIDGTADADADVPDSFLAVQWTKASGGEVSPAFVARVQKLLTAGTASPVAGSARPELVEGVDTGASSAAVRPGSATPATVRASSQPKWLKPVLASAALVIVALAVTLYRRPVENAAAGSTPTATAPAAGAAEPGRIELARLRQRIVPDRWQREDFLALRPELDRLIEQHPDLADAWALRSIIHSLQVARSFDYGTQPLLAGKDDADRALRLDHDSALGELALGLHYTAMLIRGGDPSASRTHLDRALRVLPRDSLTRYADLVADWLGYRFDETERDAKRWLEEEPENNFPCWVLAQSTLVRRREAEARHWSEATIAKGSGITWVRGFYTLFECEYYLAGDLVAARRALERIPAEFRTNHRVVYGLWLLACAEDKPDLALQELNRLPDPILADRNFHGPKALLAALAHRQAGRAGAAVIQFAEAEKILRQMLAGDSDNEELHAILAFALAGLGRPEAARAELALIEPLIAGRPPGVYIGHLHSWLAQTYLELNDVPAFLPWFRKLLAGPSVNPLTAASLRVDPRFKRTLALPEVQALLVEIGREAAAATTPAVLSTPELAEIGRLLDRKSIGAARAEVTAEKLRLLDELARKAIAATPNNAEAWAVATEIDLLFDWTGRDRSRERQAQMQQRMLRALELDPKNFDVRWIQASVLSRLPQTPAGTQEVANLVQALQREQPDHEGAAFMAAWMQYSQGQRREAAEIMMKLQAYGQAYNMYRGMGDWGHAEEAARKFRDTPNGLRFGLAFLAEVQVVGREDLEAALTVLDQLPLAARFEDTYANLLFELHMLRRDPDKALEALAGLPQAWVNSMPVAYLRGNAHHRAGRNEAAQIEWRQALAQVEERLKVTPNNAELLIPKAQLLARLGDLPEALRVAEQQRQLAGRAPDDYGWLWDVQLLAGRKEEVLRWLERNLPRDRELRVNARYSALFDPLRGDPRFEKLLRETLPAGAKPFDESKPLGRQ